MKLKNVLKFLTFTFALLMSSLLAAQTIKGKVTDSFGEGLPYVNVIEKGRTSQFGFTGRYLFARLNLSL
jgi:iron complex outermembrane receptor protein